jgi:ribose transport system substrate-binding protein
MRNPLGNTMRRRTMKFQTPSRRAASGMVAVMAMAGLLSACGSSSSDSDATANATTSKSESSAATTMKTPLGDVDVTKSYAPGVPSFADLYKSTETAPPSSSPPIAKGKSVVFLSCGQQAAGCSTPAKNVGTVAKLVGWKYSVVDGQLGANNGYQKAMEQAIAQKPDAIVLWGENCTDVKQSILSANAAGIKVFGAGSSDCDDKYTPSGPQKALFAGNVIFNPEAKTIGELYKQIGQSQAAAAINASQGKAQVMRPVTDTISFAQWETEGQDEMLKRCSGCKVVAEQKYSPGEIGPTGPLIQKFTSDLTKYPDANTTLLAFDSFTTTGGFSKAIVQAARANKMYTAAAEGYSDGMALIRQGNQGLQSMPSYSADWIAWATVDELNRLFNNQPLVPEGIGVRLVDATHNLPPEGKDYQSPVDFASAYKKAWGIG